MSMEYVSGIFFKIKKENKKGEPHENYFLRC